MIVVCSVCEALKELICECVVVGSCVRLQRDVGAAVGCEELLLRGRMLALPCSYMSLTSAGGCVQLHHACQISFFSASMQTFAHWMAVGLCQASLSLLAFLTHFVSWSRASAQRSWCWGGQHLAIEMFCFFHMSLLPLILPAFTHRPLFWPNGWMTCWHFSSRL
jgi:hypothetical protein